MEKINFSFPIEVTSPLVKINNLISKARVRIFYRGLNRNRTFITDEVAEELVQTLPYVPVCGFYDEEDEDFLDHGKSTERGPAFGVVPVDNNFQWEEHEDDDGITRTYATCDVFLWTGRYEQANKVVGKSQSMELDPKSIEGNWEYDEDGIEFFKFTKASFLGLQCLGDSVEPCFEGASFFSLYEDIRGMLEELRQYQLSLDNNNDNKGGKENVMAIFTKNRESNINEFSSIFNKELNEDGEQIIDKVVLNVDENCVYAYDYNEQKLLKYNYSIEDENKVIDMESPVTVSYLLMDETTYTALNSLKEMNDNSFEKIDENYSKLKSDNENFSQLLEEKSNKNTEYSETITTLENDNQQLQSKIESYEAELESLREYKKAQDDEQKNKLIEKFSKVLSVEEIEGVKADLEQYSVESLKSKLATMYVEKIDLQNENFSLNPTASLKDQSTMTSKEKLVNQHKN